MNLAKLPISFFLMRIHSLSDIQLQKKQMKLDQMTTRQLSRLLIALVLFVSCRQFIYIKFALTGLELISKLLISMEPKRKHPYLPKKTISKDHSQKFSKSVMEKGNKGTEDQAQSTHRHNKSADTVIANISNLSLAKNTKIKHLSERREQQQKSIQRQLEIALEAKEKYHNRLNSDKLYLQYDINPFSQVFIGNKKQWVSELGSQETNRLRPKISFLEAIQDKKTKSLYKEFQERKKIKSNQAIKLMANRPTKRSSETEQLISKHLKPASVIDYNSEKYNTQIFKKSDLQQLQQIVSIKEESFFLQKRDRQYFNLFEVVRNPKHVMFQSGKQQLSNSRFLFVLIYKYNQENYAYECTRNLSTHARTAAVTSDSDKIPEDYKFGEMHFQIDVNRLRFDDLIFIANGQLTPEVAVCKLEFYERQAIQYTIINQNIYREIKNNQQSQEEAENRQQKIGDDYFQINRLQYEKLIQFTNKQLQQIELSTKELQQFKNLLQRQMHLVQKRIKNRALHKEIEQRQNEILHNQIQRTKQIMSNNKDEVEKHIKKSKVQKHKTVSLLVKDLNKNLQLKHRFQRLTNSRNKLQNQKKLNRKSRPTSRLKSNQKSVPKQISLRGHIEFTKG